MQIYIYGLLGVRLSNSWLLGFDKRAGSGVLCLAGCLIPELKGFGVCGSRLRAGDGCLCQAQVFRSCSKAQESFGLHGWDLLMQGNEIQLC